MTVGLVQAPENYGALLGKVEGVRFADGTGLAPGSAQAMHVFLLNRDEIEDMARQAIETLALGGMLWLSWAKKSSGLHRGVTEDDLRKAVIELAFVHNVSLEPREIEVDVAEQFACWGPVDGARRS